MKKISMTVLAVALFAFALVASAQDAVPFLKSRSALCTYMVDQARQMGISIYVPLTPDYQQAAYTNEVWKETRTSAEMASWLQKTELPIGVYNTEDWVYRYDYIANAEGYHLFWGWSYSKPEEGKGGIYYLPSFLPKLTLASRVPIRFDKSVKSANFWKTGSEGQTWGAQTLDINGNIVFFNPDDCGQGYLAVTTADNMLSLYDLRHGGTRVRIVPLEVAVEAVTIDAVVSLTDPDTVSDTIPSYDGVGRNSVYELTMTGKGITGFDIKTSEGYSPLRYLVRRNSTADWIPYERKIGVGTFSVAIPFSPGIWYVVPEWDPNQFREPSQDGGGKGKGVAVPVTP